MFSEICIHGKQAVRGYQTILTSSPKEQQGCYQQQADADHSKFIVLQLYN